MQIIPTRGSGPRLFLSITAELPDGRQPTGYFRGSSVGVGGRHLTDRLGLKEDAVRAATHNEKRRLARLRIADMLEQHPDAVITVQRTRHNSY